MVLADNPRVKGVEIRDPFQGIKKGNMVFKVAIMDEQVGKKLENDTDAGRVCELKGLGFRVNC